MLRISWRDPRCLTRNPVANHTDHTLSLPYRNSRPVTHLGSTGPFAIIISSVESPSSHIFFLFPSRLIRLVVTATSQFLSTNLPHFPAPTLNT